uniref:ShKT domain-containing protein n=1 Tax=Meloidogyne hapla TaxID=6305 RepID=A0A1I8BNY5_MELHA
MLELIFKKKKIFQKESQFNKILLQILIIFIIVPTSQEQQSFSFFVKRICPGGFPADTHNFCSFWAAIGECSKNPKYMQRQCIASCNVCPVQQKVTLPPPIPPPTNQQLPPTSFSKLPPLFSSQIATCLANIQTTERPTRTIPTREQFENRGFSIGCVGRNEENICSLNFCYHLRYRTFDGSCNNLLEGRSLRGAAFMPFGRLRPANYEDGVARMVGVSKPMPNPRTVTHLLLSSSFVVLTTLNGLLMQFGQFLSHDITRNTVTNFCRCETVHEECANMPVPLHDTRFRKQQPNFCIPMTRSSVYGSNQIQAQEMRVGALLRTLPLPNPPFSAVPPPAQTESSNLVTGDNRGNLFVGLMGLHTIFVRLHNRIATTLTQLNPHWDQDRVYQETRKIVGAILQAICYQEFLPSLLGDRFKKHIPPYSGYNSNEEPAIVVEFTSGAYRLHGLIREFYQLADSNFRKIGDVRFVSNAGSVDLIVRTGTDQLIRGMMAVPSKKPQRLAPAVTEELFDISDMGSLNIQRGRDQGVRPYNDYREICGLKRLTSFQQWPEVIEPEVRNRVAALYSSIDDVDLYVGGLLEAPIDNSLLGPTFSCIIADQFRRLRDADRFFYLNPGVFTQSQVKSIQQTTLSFCICATGEDFKRINPNAFLVENGSTTVPCSSIPQLDLNLTKI